MAVRRGVESAQNGLKNWPLLSLPTMFWRAVFWIAIAEVLICVLPIELAGLTALLRLFVFGN